jgi:hypothetical protein
MQEKTTMYFLPEFDELITKQENRSPFYEDNYIWDTTLSLTDEDKAESWTVNFLENWGLN